MKSIVNVLGRFLWIVVCVVVFITTFGVSLAVKLSSLTGIDANSFTLQNAATEEIRYAGEVVRETISVPYIRNDGTEDIRDIIVARPADAQGDIPLIYIPHYAMEENTVEFQEYMSHGWAVASPVFSNEYNGILTGDDLVFNNAALYIVRHLAGIDAQRIAIVGGSAGGYMSLMLNELQMGTCAAIANSPIANVYYNLYIYFAACDEVNRNSGFTDIILPIQLLVSKSFRVNLDNFPDVDDADRWAALSPVRNAKTFSNPVVINHFTGDILVPVDQITKKYTYTEMNESFPDGFPIMMGTNYPGILSRSLEEAADPNETSVEKYGLENKCVNMEMPVSDKLLTINIFDDGPMDPKGSHTAPGTYGSLDSIPYLESMFEKSLANTEKLVPEKLMLMIERYEGNSVQLPAHEGINDAIYGSKAVYRLEVVEELQQYVHNHSLSELDKVMEDTLILSDDKEHTATTWKEIRNYLME